MTETSTLQGENIQITIPLPPITKKNHQQISRTPQGVRGLKSERAIGVGRELGVAPSKGA